MTKDEFQNKCNEVISRIAGACKSLPMTGYKIVERHDIRMTVHIKSLIPEIGFQEWCCWLDKAGEAHYARMPTMRFV